MAESRHPEWDLMFASGITRPRIAELCHAKPATVFAHFKNRIDADPSILTTHEANRLKGENRRPTKAERARIDQLVEFVGREARFPATSGECVPEEVQLGQWLSKQRHHSKAGDLPNAVRSALDDIGDWDRSPKAVQDEQRWREQFQTLVGFQREFGRWPAYKPAVPEPEHGLGVWLHMQRQKSNNHSLPATYQDLLDSELPGWRGRGR